MSLAPSVSGAPGEMGARLPYRAIVALMRASHQTRTETRTETKAKEFSAGRAILSGGLMLRKSVTREERSVGRPSANRYSTYSGRTGARRRFAGARNTLCRVRRRGGPIDTATSSRPSPSSASGPPRPFTTSADDRRASHPVGPHRRHWRRKRRGLVDRRGRPSAHLFGLVD